MKTWSMAINEQEGDIDTMPVALAKSLMPAKLRIKNPFRDNGDKPSDNAATKDVSPHPALPPSLLTPALMPYYQLHPQYYSTYNGHYHQPGYLPPPPQVPVHVAASPKRPDSVPHRFHPNSTHAQINSLTTSNGSSNGIPPSLISLLHAWKY